MKQEKNLQKLKEREIQFQIKKWEFYLNSWKDTYLNDKKVEVLWVKGLPARFRGELWMKIIGNESHITRDLFEILKRKKSISLNFEHNEESSMNHSSQSKDKELDPLNSTDSQSNKETNNFDNKNNHDNENGSHSKDLRSIHIDEEIEHAFSDREHSISLIKMDLDRTFPQLRFFQKGGPYHDNFKTILECFTKYRPDIGYVQGQSFLLAMLMLNMDSYESFVCFTSLLSSTRFHFNDFFRMDVNIVNIYTETLQILLRKHLPQVYQHFQDINVDLSICVLNWFITLFSKTFSLEICSRLWDLYLYYGSWYIFQEALGILKYYSQDYGLLKKNFEECMYILSHNIQVYNDEPVKENEFFECIFSIKLNQKKVEDARNLAVLQTKE